MYLVEVIQWGIIGLRFIIMNKILSIKLQHASFRWYGRYLVDFIIKDPDRVGTESWLSTKTYRFNITYVK
jgi:hypothetical protein